MSLRFKTLTSQRAVNEPQQLMRSCQAIKTCSLLTVLLHIYLLKRDLRLFKYELEMLQYNYLSKLMFISSFFICSAGMWHWISLQEISWQIPWTRKQNKRKDTENVASGLSRKIKQIKCSCYLNAITWLWLRYFQLFSTIQHTTGMKIMQKWYDPLVAIDKLGPFRKYLFWNLTENAQALNTNRRTESKCVYISVFIYQTNRFFKVLLHNNRDCSQGHCKMLPDDLSSVSIHSYWHKKKCYKIWPLSNLSSKESRCSPQAYKDSLWC